MLVTIKKTKQKKRVDRSHTVLISSDSYSKTNTISKKAKSEFSKGSNKQHCLCSCNPFQ